MKAIVNVHKASNQSRNNGLTFRVKEVLSTIVALEIPSNEMGIDLTTDFSFREVFIVDFENELKIAYKDLTGGFDLRTFDNLCAYADNKGMRYKKSYEIA
jgi:hypothetical protein